MKKLISFLLMLSMAVGSPALAAPSAEEGFRTNLTELHGLNGSWTVEKNGLHAVGNGDCFAMSETTAADFTYSTQVTLKGNGAASLVFRSNDDGSRAYVANVDLNRGDARLFKFPADGVFEFGTFAVDRSVREYTLRVDCVGSSIRFYLNGKLAVEAEDSSYSEGKLGLLIWSNNATFQEVLYTPVEASQRPSLTELRVVDRPDALCFDRALTDFHGRLPYATDSIRMIPTVDSADTEIDMEASCNGKITLPRTQLTSGSPSPSIPLSVGVNTITYRLTKPCSLMADGKITESYTVTLRRMAEGEKTDYDLSYADIVEKMTDLTDLAEPVQKGESSSESTSYDRRSTYNEITGKYQNWDANDDWGTSFERSSDGGYILADITGGAGAIVRIWSAGPKTGHVKIFIDGSEVPAVDQPFIDYFGGSFPFSLADISYDAARGKNCYLPISFNQSCRVIAYGDWGRYYHIGYISFADGVSAEPFSLPLTADGQKALLDAQAIFSDLLEKKTGSVQTVTVPAGESVELLSAAGSGAVTQITVKPEDYTELGDDWRVLSELAISAYWDSESDPSVWTTLGDFFGSICGSQSYSSLPMGVYDDGTMIASWYMPYSNGAKILLKNDGSSPRKISYSVTTEKLDRSEADTLLRFHAKWNRLTDPTPSDRWPDSAILNLKGSGRFVGTSMHIYKEKGVGDPDHHSDWWWGEGDEKFFVDNEKFPSWFGTGSEDYFGYAWGSWYPFSRPYHAQPFTNGGMWGIGNRLNNRFHILDAIPFEESFDAYIEKYHRDGYSNQVVTNYFYLEKGQTDGYGPVSLAERTEYYDLPYPEPSLIYEGEAMKIIECTGMDKAETQDMSPFGNGWSGGSQLIFKSGNGSYLKLYLNAPETAIYDLSAIFTKAGDFGIAQHLIDGEPLGKTVDLYNNGVIRSDKTLLASKVRLSAGLHVLEIRMVDKDRASSGYFYGLDQFILTKVGEATEPPATTENPGTTLPPVTTEAPDSSNPPVTTGQPSDSGNVPDDSRSFPTAVLLAGAGVLLAAAATVTAILLIRKKKH